VCTHFPLLRSSKGYEHNHKTSFLVVLFYYYRIYSVEVRDGRHGNLIFRPTNNIKLLYNIMYDRHYILRSLFKWNSNSIKDEGFFYVLFYKFYYYTYSWRFVKILVWSHSHLVYFIKLLHFWNKKCKPSFSLPIIIVFKTNNSFIFV